MVGEVAGIFCSLLLFLTKPGPLVVYYKNSRPTHTEIKARQVMKRADIVELIHHTRSFDPLEQSLINLTPEVLSEHLLFCGVIPEQYQHDSSDEKLWAKYCDIILSISFRYLGLKAEVIRTRGDSADVLASSDDYTIVGDAKAFRLSRTAKNQKDFKVTALNDWRRENTFACLVSPLTQYPSGTSQIYQQAEMFNVTLISYIHLKFLLDQKPKESLKRLWATPGTLTPSKDARRYWEAIDDAVVSLTGSNHNTLHEYKSLEINSTRDLGEEGIAYWQSVVQSYQEISREEAIVRLIRAEKIEEKIKKIREIINRRLPDE